MPVGFQRETIFYGPPAERVLLVTGDIDGDGDEEIVVGGRIGSEGLFWYDREASGEWREHRIDDTYDRLEAGGALHDLDGDGRLDFVGGGDFRGDLICWWHCPEDPTQPWTRRVVCQMPATQSHDQLVADLDGDGRPELYFWNQRGKALYVAYVPDDPTVSPWPDVRPILTGEAEEGFAVADLDGDGKPELLAGLSWYRIPEKGRYERHRFAEGFMSPRLVVGDFRGTGRNEIFLAEGDASYQRESKWGRCVHLRPRENIEELWHAEVLHEELEDPHTVLAHDFDGDGLPEVFVGELGSPRGDHRHSPAHRLYDFRDGRFVEQVVDAGIGTHEAKLIRLGGKVGIAGKPYRGLRSDLLRHPEEDAIHVWMPVVKSSEPRGMGR
jgi:hypothetical protein